MKFLGWALVILAAAMAFFAWVLWKSSRETKQALSDTTAKTSGLNALANKLNAVLDAVGVKG